MRDHSHGKAFGKIDRQVVIFFFQVTLIHQDICSQQPFYLSYTLFYAVKSGRISFNKGVFSGSFGPSIAKELRALGAKDGSWRILLSNLPIGLKNEIGAIQKSYGVTANKAKFLARQETKLLTTTLKEVRYVDAGVTKYKWKSVTGTAAHPVRPRLQLSMRCYSSYRAE